jgi:hypothetical protein
MPEPDKTPHLKLLAEAAEAARVAGLSAEAARIEALAASIEDAWSERVARRDRILRQIALEHYPGVPLRRLADELSRDVRRYQRNGAWRFDRRRPPKYPSGSFEARRFEAFQASDGRVPGSETQMARILKPLFQQTKGPPSTRSVHAAPMAVFSAAMSTIPKMADVVSLRPSDQKVLRAVIDSAPGKAAATKLAADELAERKRQAAALVELEKEALGVLPDGRESYAQDQAELKVLEERVRLLKIKLTGSIGTRIGASFAFEARRNELENALRASASPAIGAFIREMREEMTKTRNWPVVTDGPVRSLVTGKKVGSGKSNTAAIVLRLHAIRRAIEDAERLYLVPDQDDVAERLEALKSALPSAEVISVPPRYGSSALLSDLDHVRMPIKEALAKHCPGETK